jgi:putative hydrolase of the HAD superfamily
MVAIVFDLDDTLYPRVRHVYSGFSAVARAVARRFDVPIDAIYGRLRAAHEEGHRGLELQQMCASFGLDETLVPDLVQIMRSHQPQIWLSHDAAEALLALRARGWRTAVLTNGLPASQAAKVRALGLHDLVDHVIYADEHAPGGKPAPEPFLAVLNRLEVTPQNAVMVGDDRVNDIEGARALGMRTILLARGPRPHHDGARPQPDGGADAVVQDLTEVPRVALALVQNRVAHAA